MQFSICIRQGITNTFNESHSLALLVINGGVFSSSIRCKWLQLCTMIKSLQLQKIYMGRKVLQLHNLLIHKSFLFLLKMGSNYRFYDLLHDLMGDYRSAKIKKTIPIALNEQMLIFYLKVDPNP